MTNPDLANVESIQTVQTQLQLFMGRIEINLCLSQADIYQRPAVLSIICHINMPSLANQADSLPLSYMMYHLAHQEKIIVSF